MKMVRLATLLGALVALAALVWPPPPARELASARLAYRAGDLDQCLRLARRAVALGRGTVARRLDSLALQARAALDLGRPDMARRYLRGMLALDPSRPRAYLMRGSIRLRRGEPSGALADLDRGLELAGRTGKRDSPFLAPYYARRGMANLALGRLQQARRDAEQARRGDPDQPEVHQLLSKLEERDKRWLEALKEAETAFRLAQERHGLFFLNEQGQKWLKRLLWLRLKNKVDILHPYRGE